MRISRKAWLAVWAALLTIAGVGQRAGAQQTPPPSAGGASQQSGLPGQTGTPNPAPGQPHALDNPILEEADGDQVVTHLDTHFDFEYRHDQLDGGSNTNAYKFTFQESIGPTQRFAVAIELPFVNFNGGDPEEPEVTGFGDMKLRARGMIWKGEKFEHAAELELTLPSASNDALGEGQSVLRMVWGFSGQLTEHTLLSGEIGYNKALVNHRSGPGINSIEPELILSQQLAKRIGAYLDWDNYYEFSIDEYIQTMKVGLEFALDKKENSSLAATTGFARKLEVSPAASQS